MTNKACPEGIAFTPEQLTAIRSWAAHMRPRGIARVAIEPHHEDFEELAAVFLRWADGPTWNLFRRPNGAVVIADLDYDGEELESVTMEEALNRIEGTLNEADTGASGEPPEHFRAMEPVRILR